MDISKKKKKNPISLQMQKPVTLRKASVTKYSAHGKDTDAARIQQHQLQIVGD